LEFLCLFYSILFCSIRFLFFRNFSLFFGFFRNFSFCFVIPFVLRKCIYKWLVILLLFLQKLFTLLYPEAICLYFLYCFCNRSCTFYLFVGSFWNSGIVLFHDSTLYANNIYAIPFQKIAIKKITVINQSLTGISD